MLLEGRRLLVVGEDEELRRLVEAAAEAQGAEVLHCGGGREALARADAGGADAAIVDLPLSDLRGDVFLVALRDRGLPCVAVSGVLRGRRYARHALQFGALSYLEKPFRMETALGAIAQALPDAIDPDTQPAFGVAATPVIAPAVTDPSALSVASPQATQSRRASTSTLSAALSDPSALSVASPEATRSRRALTPAPTELPLHADSLIYSLARPALDETLPGIPLAPPPPQGFELPLPEGTPVPMPVAATGAPVLPQGPLAGTAVPRLLVALHAANATGALTLARGAVKKLIFLERGRAVLATSNVAEERFGARCVREGLLDREEHAALAAELGATSSLGDALVASGRLGTARQARMIAEQVREIVWSTFRWCDGDYRFIAGPLPRRRRVPLELAVGDLVLEGHRRASALEWLRGELPGRLALAPRADAAFRLDDLELAPAEASLLALADGTKTVRDLLLLAQLPERGALALLQGCRDLGLLDEVSRVLAGTRRIGFM